MTIADRIQRLPSDVRDRVRERAAILWADGMPEDEAEERALFLEAGVVMQRELPEAT